MTVCRVGGRRVVWEAVCHVGSSRGFSGRRKFKNFVWVALSSSVLCDILMNKSGS